MSNPKMSQSEKQFLAAVLAVIPAGAVVFLSALLAAGDIVVMKRWASLLSYALVLALAAFRRYGLGLPARALKGYGLVILAAYFLTPLFPREPGGEGFLLFQFLAVGASVFLFTSLEAWACPVEKELGTNVAPLAQMAVALALFLYWFLQMGASSPLALMVAGSLLVFGGIRHLRLGKDFEFLKGLALFALVADMTILYPQGNDLVLQFRDFLAGIQFACAGLLFAGFEFLVESKPLAVALMIAACLGLVALSIFSGDYVFSAQAGLSLAAVGWGKWKKFGDY
jgi:hypothetical protein